MEGSLGKLPDWSGKAAAAAVVIALVGVGYMASQSGGEIKGIKPSAVKPGKKARQKAKRKIGDPVADKTVVSTPASTPAAVPPESKRHKPALTPPVVVSSVEEAVRQAQAAPESDFPSLAPPAPPSKSAKAKGKGKKAAKANGTISFADAAAKAASPSTSNGRPTTAESLEPPSAGGSSGISRSSESGNDEQRDANGGQWERAPGSDDEYAGSWESVPQSAGTRSKTTSRSASTFASPVKSVPGSASTAPSKKARTNAAKTAAVKDAKDEAERLRLEALRQHRAAAAAAMAQAAKPKLVPTSKPGASSSSKAVGGGMRATVADDSLIWEP